MQPAASARCVVLLEYVLLLLLHCLGQTFSDGKGQRSQPECQRRENIRQRPAGSQGQLELLVSDEEVPE